MGSGDCLVLHARINHCATGNLPSASCRRAPATHWVGDDITHNDKPIETEPPQRREGLVHGASLECAALPPRVRWRKSCDSHGDTALWLSIASRQIVKETRSRVGASALPPASLRLVSRKTFDTACHGVSFISRMAWKIAVNRSGPCRHEVRQIRVSRVGRRQCSPETGHAGPGTAGPGTVAPGIRRPLPGFRKGPPGSADCRQSTSRGAQWSRCSERRPASSREPRSTPAAWSRDR